MTRTMRDAEKQKAEPGALDGPDEMFPLLKASTVAERLDCSPDTVHALWQSGQLRYVLLPSGFGGGSPENEARRRRCRSDDLRAYVQRWGSSEVVGGSVLSGQPGHLDGASGRVRGRRTGEGSA